MWRGNLQVLIHSTSVIHSKQVEREKLTLTTEKERLQANLRGFENDLHALELNLGQVERELMHKAQTEKRIGEMRQELSEIGATLKVTLVRLLIAGRCAIDLSMYRTSPVRSPKLMLQSNDWSRNMHKRIGSSACESCRPNAPPRS